MKSIKYFIQLITSLVALTIFNLSAGAMEVSPEATEEVRVVAAQKKLNTESDTLVVFAKGLCCPSCAIGVRKMISRLDFVDRKRFNKGVDLDTKVQLITVAIGEEKTPDYESLTEAIVDSGYDPVHSYSLNEGNLLTKPLITDS
jgi:hypothetical protein